MSTRNQQSESLVMDLDLGGSDRRRPAAGRGAGQSAQRDLFAKIEVNPFTVLFDCNEGLPYSFDGMTEGGRQIVVPIEKANLLWGDYTICGMDTQVSIERKSLDDLYKTLTHGRARFKNEIIALNEPTYQFAAVVIEATMEEIANPLLQDPAWENGTNPASIVGTIWQWQIRWPRVHWWPAGSRRGAEKWTFMMLRRFWDEKRKEEKRAMKEVKREGESRTHSDGGHILSNSKGIS